VVDPDLAEFVDDDRSVAEHRVLEQAVEQSGLAGAEEAGDHRDGEDRKVISHEWLI
jgi:hypothetical protein